MTKICPECKTENDENERFCRNCGINLYDSHKTELYVSKNKGIAENKWAQRLFFWQDKRTREYRLAKSKIIGELVFLIIFLLGMYFYAFVYEAEYNLFISIISSIILGLIFSVPVFAIGFLIHYLINR